MNGFKTERILVGQVIVIETVVASQDAEEVERLVTVPLEHALHDLAGFALTESSAMPGLSRVVVTCADDPTAAAIRQIESAVELAWTKFSAVAAKPVVLVRSSRVNPYATKLEQ